MLNLAKILFILSNDVYCEDTVANEGEPVTGKNFRPEQDFEQLFGPHYHSGRKTGSYSTAAEEMREYFLIPHIPTKENPLQWWVRHHDSFLRLAKLCKSYLAVPALFQLPASRAREFFHWLGIPSADNGRASIQPMSMPSYSYMQTRIEK